MNDNFPSPTLPRTPNDLDRALARAVARARRSIPLSEASFAARLGRCPSFVASLESGRSRISPSMVVEVARALGISGAALLQEADAAVRR